jgi:hypothetical protein
MLGSLVELPTLAVYGMPRYKIHISGTTAICRPPIRRSPICRFYNCRATICCPTNCRLGQIVAVQMSTNVLQYQTQ